LLLSRRAMTFNDIVREIYQSQELLFHAKFTKKQVEMLVTSFLKQIVDATCVGDEVKIKNFATIHVTDGAGTRARGEGKKGKKSKVITRTPVRMPKISLRTSQAWRHALYSAYGVNNGEVRVQKEAGRRRKDSK